MVYGTAKGCRWFQGRALWVLRMRSVLSASPQFSGSSGLLRSECHWKAFKPAIGDQFRTFEWLLQNCPGAREKSSPTITMLYGWGALLMPRKLHPPGSREEQRQFSDFLTSEHSLPERCKWITAKTCMTGIKQGNSNYSLGYYNDLNSAIVSICNCYMCQSIHQKTSVIK